MIFWFHVHKLRYVHYRLAFVSLMAIYHYLGMSQRANIRNVNSFVVQDSVEYKKDNLDDRFLKPEFPFKFMKAHSLLTNKR